MDSKIVAFAGTLALVGCVKDDSPDIPVAEVYQVVDHVFQERALIPMTALANALGAGAGAWSAITAHTCASIDSITGDTANFPTNGPVMIYLHFPDTGCTDIDGHVRSGRVVLTISDHLGVPGAKASIMSDDLTDGPCRYRFAITDSTTGTDSLFVRIDSSFIYSAGDWGRRLRGDAHYAMTAGQGDDDHANDVYTITTAFTGGDRYGVQYSCTSGQPLVFAIACPRISAGTETIEPDDHGPRELDYGSGGCDDHLDFQAEGQSFGLTIP
jgi:hypothetical protein